MTEGHISALEKAIDNLSTSAQTTIDDAMVFNDVIWIVTNEEIGSELVNETHQAIVRKVTDFAAEVVDIVTTKLAPCYPVWAVYTSLYVTFCESVLGGLVSKWRVLMKWSMIGYVSRKYLASMFISLYTLNSVQHFVHFNNTACENSTLTT